MTGIFATVQVVAIAAVLHRDGSLIILTTALDQETGGTFNLTQCRGEDCLSRRTERDLIPEIGHCCIHCHAQKYFILDSKH